jgi:ribosomal protein S16
MDAPSINKSFMNSIRTFIDKWPTRETLASEVGVSKDVVHKWAQRGAIPAEHHLAIIEAAQRRGYSDDPLILAKLHSSMSDLR